MGNCCRGGSAAAGANADKDAADRAIPASTTDLSCVLGGGGTGSAILTATTVGDKTRDGRTAAAGIAVAAGPGDTEGGVTSGLDGTTRVATTDEPTLPIGTGDAENKLIKLEFEEESTIENADADADDADDADDESLPALLPMDDALASASNKKRPIYKEGGKTACGRTECIEDKHGVGDLIGCDRNGARLRNCCVDRSARCQPHMKRYGVCELCLFMSFKRPTPAGGFLKTHILGFKRPFNSVTGNELSELSHFYRIKFGLIYTHTHSPLGHYFLE